MGVKTKIKLKRSLPLLSPEGLLQLRALLQTCLSDYLSTGAGPFVKRCLDFLQNPEFPLRGLLVSKKRIQHIVDNCVIEQTDLSCRSVPSVLPQEDQKSEGVEKWQCGQYRSIAIEGEPSSMRELGSLVAAQLQQRVRNHLCGGYPEFAMRM
eukprot:TRINITY_DN20787_c0_g2_i2.p1 TRINITY_DN20787_c0_g2~~TRINITY_DN20787_c0_g2_i2.p1  ORF type:complete len:162 (+),score=22.28 TRINITY_DN20787_c0_g2_i2:33-488(+)